MDTITTTQPPFHLKNLNLPPPQPPPSIAELRHISAALSLFLRDYDDLHSHISSVNASLDEKLSLHYKGNAVNFNDSVKNVLEGPVVEPNPRHSVRMHASSDNLISDGVVNDALEVVVSEGVKNYCDRIVSDDLKEIVLEGSESECERGDGNVRMYGSVKMEESDCAEIIIDVSEAVVSEQNLNGSESDHIVTEFGEARVSGQTSNSAASECEQGDKGEKIEAAKNVEETDCVRPINELLEDNVRKPPSSSSLENNEETFDEDGEIEASKKPEDADYNCIVTELPEDIDVVPKPRAAIDSDQSYDKPQSPNSLKNRLDEIDVLMNPEDENHEQTDVSMEANVSEKYEEMDSLKNPAESDVSEKPEEIDIAKNPEETDVSKKRKKADVSEKRKKADVSEKRKKADVSEKPQYVEILKNPKPAVSELEMLCKSMSGRELKKYVVKHILDSDKLRTELLKALKLARNPARLVLDSIGTYFLESSKTYHYDTFQCLKDKNDGREASLLILECFVMISGDGIEISRKDEANAAEDANRWKTRMNNECGLKYTEEADARGLLLLISGFGISDRFFSTVDIMNLMRASNVKGISNILRHSIVLMPKIPEVIDMMVMSKLEVKAADIAYTFGLEDKCHPLTILTKFLRSINKDIESGSRVPKIFLHILLHTWSLCLGQVDLLCLSHLVGIHTYFVLLIT